MSRTFLLIVAALLSAAPIQAQGETDPIQVAATDWPWWRGPAGTGVAAPNQKPPTTWSDTQNVLWRADVPGRGHASPTVVGDYVYLPTADHQRGAQVVMCFDRQTGKLLWQTDVHKGGLMKGNRKASQASSSIACDGKRLYINFLNGGAVITSALDRQGKVLWQTKISKYVVHQGYGSSPVLHGPLVIVSADNKGGGAIAGLARETGKIVWRVDRPKKPNYPSPAVVHAAGRTQLVFTGCDLVSSFDPLTGKKLWEFPGATTECVTTTVTDGKHVYTSGGYPKNHVSAVRADGSGEISWRTGTRVYVPSMLVHEGYLYAVSDAGSAICWKADTGDQAWKERLGGTFSASLVLANGNLYATNEKSETFVYKADPTKFELIAKNKLGQATLSTPAICGGRIYMRIAQTVQGERRETLVCVAE